MRCAPTALPDPGLGDTDVHHEMRSSDWPAIGAAAAAALADGLDPLDREALSAHLGARLDPAARGWALSLFTDPIHIAANGAYLNGRHRSYCLRATCSPIAIITSGVAEAAAEQRLPRPSRPIVSWL